MSDTERNDREVTEAIERHGLVIGPEYKPGLGQRPRVGWAVYRDWTSAALDTFSESGSESVLAVGETIREAVRRAVAALAEPRS